MALCRKASQARLKARFKTYDETTSSGAERVMKWRQCCFPKCQNINVGQNGKNFWSAYSYYFLTKAVRILIKFFTATQK